jgi:hypothetical protein
MLAGLIVGGILAREFEKAGLKAELVADTYNKAGLIA